MINRFKNILKYLKMQNIRDQFLYNENYIEAKKIKIKMKNFALEYHLKFPIPKSFPLIRLFFKI